MAAQVNFSESDLPPPPLPPKAEEDAIDQDETPPVRPPKPSSMSPPPVGVSEEREAVRSASPESDLCILPEAR